MDVASLFEDQVFTLVFDDELEAMRSGAKPMLLASFPASLLTESDPDEEDYEDYQRLIEAAYAAGFTVVHSPETFPMRGEPYCVITLLVVRRDQLWRIPAFLTMEDALRGKPWSDGAEALRSSLLGYDEATIAAWLDKRQHQDAAWGAPTIYTLLTSDQRQQLELLGRRSFSREVLAPGLTFYEVDNTRVLRKDALSRCGELTIARIAVDHELILSRLALYFRRDVPQDVVISLEFSAEDLAALNHALRSRIELWTGSGWK